MARTVFFSFHYQRDIWRANVVRNSNVVIGRAAAGFTDGSIWEEAKKKGDKEIKKLIDDGLIGTSVTVVLIGAKTAGRTYIDYEIEKSVDRGNGILGIHIHNIADKDGNTDSKGEVPKKLSDGGYKIYTWPFDNEKFKTWIEDAYEKAHGKK
jgi:Thoeris protein ThsB, TIR-like domain